jgi:transcriptional regulator with XRE-family HTH domain
MSDPIRALLGDEIRRLREAHEQRTGWPASRIVAKVAALLGWSRASYYRTESGDRAVTAADARKLATYFRAGTETVDRLATLAEAGTEGAGNWWDMLGGPTVDWFRAYLALEAKATQIDLWYPGVPPGLFQTQDYANRVTPGLDPDEIARAVEIRMRRQLILYRPGPVTVRAFIGEAALRQEVGDEHVWREQIRHLRAVADLPNVSLRVVPLRSEGHPGMGGGPIVILRDDQDLALVYLESYSGAAWVGDPDGVVQHLELLDTIGRVALDEDRSRYLIDAIAWQVP